ncbi:MAG: DUF917 domain-containing protein, partial [Candidatus Thorarchaeota archaeon]
MTRLESRTDMEDLATGCTFFGTGGGGSKELGLKMLYPHADSGNAIELLPCEEIRESDWLACAYYSGTIAPPTPEVERARNRMVMSHFEAELSTGLRVLEDYMGVKFAAVVPFELGGVNTPAPIDAAVKHRTRCVDGDYSGRAVPEISQNTVCIKGLSMGPMALVDWYGDTTIVENIVSYEMGERISKALSEAAWGRVGNVAFPLRGAEFREAVIPGTLTTALDVGRAIRTSRESGDDPADAIAERVGGWVLFRGRVVGKKWENREGYMWGETLIRGSGVRPGSELRAWLKNANYMSWLDDRDCAMSP